MVRQMLIRRSQPQPAMKNAAAGGKMIAIWRGRGKEKKIKIKIKRVVSTTRVIWDGGHTH